ncbi:MAG: hypothetical protein WC455_12325 [Dehalococcoidia bacterium]|jgi:hypothetical protein
MRFEEIKAKLALNEAEYSIRDISHEVWREYEHGGVVFRINCPIALIIRKGGTTHRVVDVANVSHCHPQPGNGCALRWFNGDQVNPVKF